MKNSKCVLAFILIIVLLFESVLAAPFDNWISTPGNDGDGNNNVSVFQSIVFEFPEHGSDLSNVTKSGIEFSGLTTGGIDISTSGKKLIISPKSKLDYGKQYTVTLGGISIPDLTTGAITLRFGTEYDFNDLISSGAIDTLLATKSPRQLNLFVQQYINVIDVYNIEDKATKKVITSIDVNKNDKVSKVTIAIGKKGEPIGTPRTASLKTVGKTVLFNAGFQPNDILTGSAITGGGISDPWVARITAMDDIDRTLQVKDIEFNRAVEKKQYKSDDFTNKGKPYILQDLLDKDKSKFSKIINEQVTIRNMIPLESVVLNLQASRLDYTKPSMEYSYNAKDGDTGSWTRCGATTYTAINIPSSCKQIAIREMGVTNNYRIIYLQAQSGSPKITIDYLNGTTKESIPSTMEYAEDQTFTTGRKDGAGSPINLTPGSIMYFRNKATETSPPSKELKLVIPKRPAAPSISLNYSGILYNSSGTAIKVKTKEKITSAIEYSTSSAFSVAISGDGAEAALDIGSADATYYFRTKSTARGFASQAKEVKVNSDANIPTQPTITIDYANERTGVIIPNTIEYAEDELFTKNKKLGAGLAIPLTPGKDIYFRYKQTTTTGGIIYAGHLQKLVVKDRQTEPTIGTTGTDIVVNYSGQKMKINTNVEYADDKNFKVKKDGTGIEEPMVPLEKEKIIYLRKKATIDEFSGKYFEYRIPVRPAAPVYTIDYISESTKEKVGEGIEYSINSDFSSASTGSGIKLEFTTTSALGLNLDLSKTNELYFRLKSTDVSFAGKPFTLSIPKRPEIKTYSIDYANERTKEAVESNVEYSQTTAFASINQGVGAPLTILPDKTYYFRVKATDSNFKNYTTPSSVYVLPRTTAPSIAIDYVQTRTEHPISPDMEYSDSSDFKIKTDGKNENLSLTPGKDLYFRYKAKTNAFASDSFYLDVPQRPAALTASSISINFINETLDGIPAGTQYAEDKNFGSTLKNISGSSIVIEPGKNLYLRWKATETAFDSEALEMIIPKRPQAPKFTVDKEYWTTMENIPSAYEYITTTAAIVSSSAVGWVSASSGSAINISPSGINYFFRIKSTSDHFSGEIQKLTW